jgi:hypothetical protein
MRKGLYRYSRLCRPSLYLLVLFASPVKFPDLVFETQNECLVVAWPSLNKLVKHSLQSLEMPRRYAGEVVDLIA